MSSRAHVVHAEVERRVRGAWFVFGRWFVFGLAMVASSGCSPRRDAATERRHLEPVSAAEVAAVSDAETPRPAVGGDAPADSTPDSREPGSLVAHVHAVASACTIDREAMRVVGCPGGEDARARAFAARAESPADRLAALGAWTELLHSNDADARAVAALVVGPAFFSLGDPAPRPSAALAGRAIAALRGLSPGEARTAVHGVTHVAVLAGELASLLEAVRAHPGSQTLESIVWAEAMRHGADDADVLGAWRSALTSTDPTRAAAAAGAPRAATWVGADAGEARRGQDARCDAVAPRLSSSRVVRAAAARTLAWCGGRHVDPVIDRTAALVRDHELPREWALVVRDLCGPHAHDDRPATPARCRRLARELERAVADRSMAGPSRARALFALARMRPGAETRALAERFSEGADPALRAVAKRIVATDVAEAQPARAPTATPSAG